MDEETGFATIEGVRVHRWYRTLDRDLSNQIIQVELIYYVTYPDGKEERLIHSFPLRYLFRFELEHLLWRCGFELEQLYSGFDRAPYGSSYPGELIAVARLRS